MTIWHAADVPEVTLSEWDIATVGKWRHLIGRSRADNGYRVSAPVKEIDPADEPTWAVTIRGRRYRLLNRGLRSIEALVVSTETLRAWGVPEEEHKAAFDSLRT